MCEFIDYCDNADIQLNKEKSLTRNKVYSYDYKCSYEDNCNIRVKYILSKIRKGD